MPDKQERTTRKVGAWIPPELYDNLREMGYFGRPDQGEVNQTDTIVEGLKLLLEKVSGSSSSQGGAQLDDVKETVGDLREMGELRTQVGALMARNEELLKFNQKLEGELDQAHRDKEVVQNLYDNYMRQMQTLIQQKAIEAPGAKKWWQIWK